MAHAAHLDSLRRTDAAGFFPRLREALASYRVYRDTLAELDRLSDRELADLNLSRHMLRDVARDAAYGR